MKTTTMKHKKAIEKLYNLLNNEIDMDGFGQGYQEGIKTCIKILEEDSELNS